MATIRTDVQRITTGAFAVPVIFTVVGGMTVLSVTCQAIAICHHLTVNEYGQAVNNGKIARVTVSEYALNALSYPVRNSSGKINLINHRVTWTDLNGNQVTFVIREQYPDETTGAIVCMLGEYGIVTPPGRTIVSWIGAPFAISIVDTVDPSVKQTLANGDIINVQYAINMDGTVTVPYLVGYVMLTPFMIDNNSIQDEVYNISTGTFDNSKYGGFVVGNQIAFNASIPVWQS